MNELKRLKCVKSDFSFSFRWRDGRDIVLEFIVFFGGWFRELSFIFKISY